MACISFTQSRLLPRCQLYSRQHRWQPHAHVLRPTFAVIAPGPSALQQKPAENRDLTGLVIDQEHQHAWSTLQPSDTTRSSKQDSFGYTYSADTQDAVSALLRKTTMEDEVGSRNATVQQWLEQFVHVQQQQGHKPNFAEASAALLLLLQQGHHRTVIEQGPQLLSNKLPKHLQQDIVVTLAKCYKAQAETLMARPTASTRGSFDAVEHGLRLLRNAHVAPLLQQELEAFLRGLAASYAVEVLTFACHTDPTTQSQQQRSRAVSVLSSVLWHAATTAVQREELMARVSNLLTAAEEVQLYSAAPSSVQLTDQELYDLALANIALGYQRKAPKYISTADKLLQRIQERSTEVDVSFERSVCALLHGGSDTQLPNDPSPAIEGWGALDMQSFADAGWLQEDAKLGVVASAALPWEWAESWLKMSVMPNFSDTKGVTVQLDQWFSAPTVLLHNQVLRYAHANISGTWSGATTAAAQRVKDVLGVSGAAIQLAQQASSQLADVLVHQSQGMLGKLRSSTKAETASETSQASVAATMAPASALNHTADQLAAPYNPTTQVFINGHGEAGSSNLTNSRSSSTVNSTVTTGHSVKQTPTHSSMPATHPDTQHAPSALSNNTVAGAPAAGATQPEHPGLTSAPVSPPVVRAATGQAASNAASTPSSADHTASTSSLASAGTAGVLANFTSSLNGSYDGDELSLWMSDAAGHIRPRPTAKLVGSKPLRVHHSLLTAGLGPTPTAAPTPINRSFGLLVSIIKGTALTCMGLAAMWQVAQRAAGTPLVQSWMSAAGAPVTAAATVTGPSACSSSDFTQALSKAQEHASRQLDDQSAAALLDCWVQLRAESRARDGLSPHLHDLLTGRAVRQERDDVLKLSRQHRYIEYEVLKATVQDVQLHESGKAATVTALVDEAGRWVHEQSNGVIGAFHEKYVVTLELKQYKDNWKISEIIQGFKA